MVVSGHPDLCFTSPKTSQNQVVFTPPMNRIHTAPNQWRVVTVFQLLVGLLFSLSAVAQPAFLKDGLVAYYPFNGNANDESGNGKNGELLGGASVIDGKLVLDGFDDWFESRDPVIPPNQNFTISIHFRHAQDQPNQHIEIASQGNTFYLGREPDGKNIRVGDNWIRAGTLLWPQDGLWHGITISSSASGTSLVIDGVVASTTSVQIYSRETAFRLGRQFGNYAEYFCGSIDNVRVYNRALSDTEVKALYDYESTPQISLPTIAIQPQNQSVVTANDATFCVTLKDAGSYNYQWQRNEQNIAGATLNCYTINSVTTGMDGSRYRVIVSNSAGTIISDSATLTVVTPPPPTIATQPAPKTVQEGANVSLSVVASGQGTLVYQWQFNEQNLSGATSSTLNLNAVKLNTAGRYRVLVSSQYGVTISDTVTLTVNANPPPTIVTQPISRTPAEGTQVSLTVTATGLGSLTYQWQVNGQNIPGAIFSTLVLSAVRPSVNGNYRVIVGNPYGTSISTEATVAVVVTDSDGDGLSDYEELLFGTNANKVDSDGDGLSDFAEVRTHGSNPLTTDTDGDGYSDGIEVARDGNPNNRSVTPTGALAVFPAVDVEFYTLNGVKYQLEVSTDMVVWTTQGGVVVGNGGSQNHLVRASKATQFWRLKVVQ